MAVSPPSTALPGQALGNRSAYISGPGTHIQGSSICASIAGPVILQDADSNQKQRATLITVGRAPLRTLESERTKHTSSSPHGRTNKKPPTFNTLPAVDSVFLGRVTRVQKRQATLSIIAVLDETQHLNADDLTDPELNALISSATDPSSTPVNTADDLSFQAIIRKEDVRAVEKDRVVMDETFRVGDIVRASVISIGDQSAYYATTSRNELGVVIARSDVGNMMVPASWKEMRDPVTGTCERRKVAKPF